MGLPVLQVAIHVSEESFCINLPQAILHLIFYRRRREAFFDNCDNCDIDQVAFGVFEQFDMSMGQKLCSVEEGKKATLRMFLMNKHLHSVEQ